MPKKVFKIPDMYGADDASVIETTLLQIVGVRSVDVQPQAKVITVLYHEPATWDDLKRGLEALGYVPQE